MAADQFCFRFGLTRRQITITERFRVRLRLTDPSHFTGEIDAGFERSDNLLAPQGDAGAEEKICIVLEGLRGAERIGELCRREGIAQSLYYSWSKEFLEAAKQRLAGDTARQATSPEVKELRAESSALKEAVADLTLENRLLKKAC